MQLDARKGDTGWWVFNVPLAQEVKRCLWVDDETLEYCVYLPPPYPLGLTEFPTVVHKAKRIDIRVMGKIVLINPVEDAAPRKRKVTTPEKEPA